MNFWRIAREALDFRLAASEVGEIGEKSRLPSQRVGEGVIAEHMPLFDDLRQKVGGALNPVAHDEEDRPGTEVTQLLEDPWCRLRVRTIVEGQ